jgi:hypothetical protein
MALMNCPLYIAPTPGMKPNIAAVPGFGAPGGGGGYPAGVNPGEYAPAPGTPVTRAARHGSQNTLPCTARSHCVHNGLPQFWQKAETAASG